MKKLIAIVGAVAAFAAATFYVLGVIGWLGEGTVVARPISAKDAKSGLVFFLPRTDLSVRVDWVVIGCDVDTSGPQPIFMPRLAMSVAVTPVTAADPNQAFVLDPDTARPWLGSEELTAKLTDAQTLAELSYSATDAILQIPGQVQKFQQQFASILAPFNISSLTSGEPEPPKVQTAYCRPETLSLIQRLRQAEDASINVDKEEAKRKDAAALVREIRERLTLRVERSVPLDADAVRKGLSVDFLPSQRVLEQVFTTPAATRISTGAGRDVMQLQLRVDPAAATALTADESAGVPYRVGAPARVRACVRRCGGDAATDDLLYSELITLPQLGVLRKVALKQRMFTDTTGRVIMRTNGAVESLKVTSKPASATGSTESSKSDAGTKSAPQPKPASTPVAPAGAKKDGAADRESKDDTTAESRN